MRLSLESIKGNLLTYLLTYINISVISSARSLVKYGIEFITCVPAMLLVNLSYCTSVCLSVCTQKKLKNCW